MNLEMDMSPAAPHDQPSTIHAIVITGPVGAGKSTVAASLCDLLADHDVRTACVDMDYFRWLQPALANDRFSAQLGYRNLAAVWPNLVAAGARCVVLADVVEDMSQRATYEEMMPGSAVTIVRLNVPLDLIHQRLAARESGEDLAWHQLRAPELQAIMEKAAIGDVVIDVGHDSPAEIAAGIFTRLALAS